jgi:hypothetical protein
MNLNFFKHKKIKIFTYKKQDKISFIKNLKKFKILIQN